MRCVGKQCIALCSLACTAHNQRKLPSLMWQRLAACAHAEWVLRMQVGTHLCSSHHAFLPARRYRAGRICNDGIPRKPPYARLAHNKTNNQDTSGRVVMWQVCSYATCTVYISLVGASLALGTAVTRLLQIDNLVIKYPRHCCKNPMIN
jgi:hypothetical protein